MCGGLQPHKASPLSLLLSLLSVLSKFRGEVRLVAVGRAGGWSPGVIKGPRVVVVVVVVVVVGTGVAFVGARVVFPVVQLAIGLHGFVGFVSFTGTGSILMPDLRVTFPIAGINILDEGM